MSHLKAVVVATLPGGNLTLHDLLYTLKLNGKLSVLVNEAVRDRLIEEAARKEGITVRDEELQKAADAFRQEMGLVRAADTHRWLGDNHLSLHDLETFLERNLVRQKLADRVTQDLVEQHFAENRAKYDRARLAHIVVAKEGVANELLSQIQEEGLDFAAAARKYSLHEPSRRVGGSLGVVARKSLSPGVESAVFSARPGDVVGPLKTDMGYHLIKVEEVLLGQLDAKAAEAIRAELFEDWLRERVKQARVEERLYEYV
jgi:putative peptide maturation system protein